MLRNLKLSHVLKSHTLLRKNYVDDSKSVLAKIKGEDIDITSDSDNEEDELEILSTFALAFVKEEKIKG